MPLWQNPQIHLDALAAAAEAARVAAEQARHDAAKAAAEEQHEKKKKPLLIAGIAGGVVVVAAVVILIIALTGGEKKKKKKGDDIKLSGVSTAEYREMESWYKKTRKLVFDYMVGLCRPLHDGGNNMWSYVVKDKDGNFKLTVKPPPGQHGKGKLKVLDCPGRLADIHRDHAFTMKLKTYYRKGKDAFTKGKNLARITFETKNAGYLKKKSYRSVVKLGKRWRCVALINTKDKGLRRLAYASFKPKKRTLKTGNLIWTRVSKKRKSKLGRFEITLKSDRISTLTAYWNTCATAFLGDFKKVRPPGGSYKDYKKLWDRGQEWGQNFCKTLTALHKSLLPFDEDKAKKAKAEMAKLKAAWNDEIRQTIVDTGAKVKLVFKGKPL